MTGENSKVRVNSQNSFNNDRFARKRTASIAERSAINKWIAADLSESLPTEAVDMLRSKLERMQNGGKFQAENTSVEALRNWANTKNGCRLGELVVSNVPVVCSGVLCNHAMEPHLKTREGYCPMPDHMRWSAHGLTYGSVFAKVFRGTDSTGKSYVKDISLFTACNNCLDIWVGPTRKGERRSDELWPFTLDEKSSSPRKSREGRKRTNSPRDRKEKKGRGQKQAASKPSGNTAFSAIVRQLIPQVDQKGNKQDPYKKVTATALKSFLKEAGYTVSGNKADLVARFGLAVTEMGDRQMANAIARKLNQNL